MSDQTATILSQQLPLALLLVYLQNFLKRQRWLPWLTYESSKLNHLFAIAASGLATFGIRLSWDASAHTLLISGLAWATILPSLWHWLVQYVLAKTAYTTLKPQLNPQPQPTAATTAVAK